ncbi:MAG: hypothetical protein ACMUJM_10005 [bacterium]
MSRRGIVAMANETIYRLRARMIRELNRYFPTSNSENIVYVTLKREQISQRYLKLMQAAVRRS